MTNLNMDNTAGYTQSQLDEMNVQIEEQAKDLNPDDASYKSEVDQISERVQANFEEIAVIKIVSCDSGDCEEEKTIKITDIQEEIELERETFYIIKTEDVQDFKDWHECNNATYQVTKSEINKNGYLMGDYSFTDISEDSYLEVAKTLKDDETAVVVMSEENIVNFVNYLHPDK